MNYVSLEFWALLALLLAVVALARLVLRGRWQPGWDRWLLLATSFVLFASESLLSFGIFLGVGLWVYAALVLLPRVPPRLKWTLVGVAVVVALQPLVFYKYWRPEKDDLLIPVGISFYTFQLLGLLVDSARESLPRMRLREFWNFASFFPQIVAGPIERRASLLPQMEGFRFRLDRGAIEAGAQWVVLGLFYKLVAADNLASSTGWITGRLENPWLVHLSNLLFGLRIYFDFCGYSLVALGLGRCLGVRLTMNFLSPYTRRNVREFWRAWHVSLSRWFRDYVYVPLGGNKARHPLVVVLAVFVISGVWHGAGWNFVLWGAAHGILLAVFRMVGSRTRMPGGISWALTFAAVMSAWLFFYQRESAVLWDKLGVLVSWRDYLGSPVGELVRVTRNLGNLAYLAGALALGLGLLALEFFSLRRGRTPYCWGSSLPAQVVMIALVVWLSPVTDNGFVYFNF